MWNGRMKQRVYEQLRLKKKKPGRDKGCAVYRTAPDVTNNHQVTGDKGHR